MKLNEIAGYLTGGKIRVVSGYNGKVLAKSYDKLKHANALGEREVVAIETQIQAEKNMGFGNRAVPVFIVHLHGYEEYKKEKENETN